jgi:hypothetical protein
MTMQAITSQTVRHWWVQSSDEHGDIPFHAVARGLRCRYRELQALADAGDIRIQRIGDRHAWPVNGDDAYRLLEREIGLGRV